MLEFTRLLKMGLDDLEVSVEYGSLTIAKDVMMIIYLWPRRARLAILAAISG